MPVITNAGEYLITQQQQAGEPLIIDQMILANITGLDSNTVPSREQSMPAPADVKIIKPITKDGLLNTNTVVYSTVFPSTDGTFDFNYMGLYSSAHDVIVAVAYVPLQTKIKTVGTDVGNVITKNFAIEFNAAADITGINISAESWQIDYTARLMSMDKHQRDLIKNIYGPSTFLNDAFKVKFETDKYYLTAGKAILGGINFDLETDLEIVPGALPQTVWLDVYQETSMMGVLNKHDVVFNDGTVLVDYVDGVVEHSLIALGVVNSSVDVVDGRSVVCKDLKLISENEFEGVSEAIKFVKSFPDGIYKVETLSFRTKKECEEVGIDFPDGGGARYSVEGSGISDGYINHQAGNKVLRLLPVNGKVSLMQAGAVGDGVSDDRDNIEALFNHAPAEAELVFDGGKTFLTSTIIIIDNSAARDFNISAYGSKIKKKDFTGSAFLRVAYNPSGLIRQNLWMNENWNFVWRGGEIDANGYNQNFREAAHLREGTGDLDLTRFDTSEKQAQALIYQGLQKDVFGVAGTAFKIHDDAGNIPHGNGNDWELVRIEGCSNVTVRDVIVRNRHEEGFNCRACTTITFDNCQDYNAIPTNDQFQIYFVGGGNFTRGQQHFAWRTLYCTTTARIRVTDASGMSVGDKVVDHILGSNGTAGIIHAINGNELELYQVEWGDGFTNGNALSVNGITTSSKVISQQVVSFPVMNVSNCTAFTGNSGIGFMDIDSTALFSTLNVVNYSSVDMCLISIRTEHVHFLNVTNSNFLMSNANSDPTDRLFYKDNAAIEQGAATRVTNLKGLTFTNCGISGSNESRQRTQIVSDCSVDYVNGTAKIDPVTGGIWTANAIVARYGDVSNIRINSRKYDGTDIFMLRTAIYCHRGQVRDVQINGAGNGIEAAEWVSDCKIENVTGYGISELWLENGTRPANISNVSFTLCGNGILIPDSGVSGDYSTCAKISDCQFRDIKKGCIVSSGPDVFIDVSDCIFMDWGLDATVANDYAACFSSVLNGGGFQARELYLKNNHFRKTKENSRTYLGVFNGLNEVFVEMGSLYYPKDVNFPRWNEGSELSVSDNLFMERTIDDTGVAVQDASGSFSGKMPFFDSRNFYRMGGDGSSKGGVRLYGLNGAEELSLVTGDFVSFKCKIPKGNKTFIRALVGGTGTYSYISESGIVVNSPNISIQIDGALLQSGDSVISYLDGGEHTIKIIAVSDCMIYQLMSSSSGVELSDFDLYEISVIVAGQADRFYAVNEGVGRNLQEASGGQVAYINYGSDSLWKVKWTQKE